MVIKAPVDRSLSLFFYFSSQKKILTAKQAQLGYSTVVTKKIAGQFSLRDKF